MIWQIWVVAGIAAAILEILTPGFFALGVGAGCLVAGIASALGGSLAAQIVAGLAGLALFMIFLRPTLLKLSAKGEKTNTERMVGMRCSVTEDIGDGEPGRVLVDGVSWRAMSDQPVKAGAKAEITGIDGSTLTVKEV